MSFDFAQTFFVDPSAVRDASDVGITAVELYFRGKPKKTNNKSGIEEPGVEISIVPCVNGIPELDAVGVVRPQEPTEHGARFVVANEMARKEWSQIQASNDASVPTVFRFARPIRFKTGFEYAIVIKFDGHEDYILWFSRQGDPIVGTNVVSPGPNGKYIGSFFAYISPTDNQNNPLAVGLGYSNTAIDAATADAGTTTFTDTNRPASTSAPGQEYLNDSWKPIPDIDLKFRVYVARYSDNGVRVTSNSTYDATTAQFAAIPPTMVSNNVIRITAPAYAQEFIMFDRSYSNTDLVRYGDWFYQEGPDFPGGTATPLTVSVTAGSINVTANGLYTYANGTTFNSANGWNAVYTKETDNEYIVIKTGATEVYVRKVLSIISNTVLQVDEPIPATNTISIFQKTAVGRLVHKSRAFVMGIDDDICILTDTNANSSIRFVNNALLSVGISNGGLGYSNSDYLVVSGYENVVGKVTGGYSAYANLVTDGSGTITNVYISNTGCGFVDSSWLTGANVVINNSSAQPVPSGTANGWSGTYVISSRIRSEISGGQTYFSNCEVVNLQLDVLKPEITVDNPVGTAFEIKHGTLFYETDDPAVTNGKVLYVQDNPQSTEMVVKIFKNHKFINAENPVYPSRSNEFHSHYANGDQVSLTTIGTSFTNAAIYAFETSSNNDFTSVFLQPEITNAHYAKFVINNDYTNEHTNYGNAYAKHVVTKVSFKEERLAEDMLVYLTAYRPLGTDFKVYARMHNSADPEAFDDKDYTLLEQVDGIGVYSSTVDDSDYIEMGFGIPMWPNAEFTQTNTVVTVLNEANVTSSGFDSNIVANDVVRVYNPLFPNNYVVDVVSSVTNSSHLILSNQIANDGVVGTMKIQKVGYPKQAFKNELNDKVVRYYNEEFVAFDRYDSFQIKVVMLSNNQNIIPNFDDVRGVSVTA